MITRQLLEPVRQALATMPAVAILGPRQVGKTTLAKQLAAQLVDEPLVITGQAVTSGQEMIDQMGQASPIREALYLDLELPDIQSKLQDPVGFLSAHQDKLIIFDEIQLAPELFQVLRGLIDANGTPTSAHPSGPIERRNGQFLLLGSASMDLLRQSSESLAGRIRYLELMGLNALEVPAHPMETPTSQRPSSDPNHLIYRGIGPCGFVGDSLRPIWPTVMRRPWTGWKTWSGRI